VIGIHQNHFKVYQCNDIFLILNPLVPSWIVTNINGVLVLKLHDGLKSFDEIANEYCNNVKMDLKDSVVRFLQMAKDARLFQDYSEMPEHKPYKLNSIYLNMTEHCNLNCVYCFASARVENGKRLLYEDYVRILNQAREMTDELTITFTGGEPLLSENTLPAARYAKSKGFGTYLLSNGTLINEDNIEALTECFDHFKISVDGSCKEVHEFFRGAGSYEPAVAAVNLLRKHNADVGVPMVVTKKNISDISSMHKKWGGLATFQPLFPLGNAESSEDLSITGAEYYDALVSDGELNPYSDLEGIIQAHAANRTIFKCAMGDGEVSISCSGDVLRRPRLNRHRKQTFISRFQRIAINSS
jgi:MoaA/NifB/PqqE/SkfB family radical SAM enzyme